MMLKFAGRGLLLALMIGMCGCPGMGGNGNENENENGNDNSAGQELNFVATLDGEQETPAVETQGTGSGTLTLNAAQTELSFTVTASGLSGPVTSAHFHVGAFGVAGPVVVDIFGSLVEVDGEITLEGVWELMPEDVTDLLNGDIYLNLHTALHPAGEIRGQLDLDE